MIVCNTRILAGPLTGQPRYTRELLSRMGDAVEQVAPVRPLTGMRGHIWEQLSLPDQVNDRLLWSPSTTGPLACRNQVVTVHDIVPFDHPEWVGKNFGRWYRFLLPQLLPRVKHIISVSYFTKWRLVERLGLPEDKISVIHSGVDTRFRPQGQDAISATINTLNLPSPRYILSVCSIEPRKNLDGLLRAWKDIADQLPEDVWLVLAGGQGAEHVFGAFDLGQRPPRVHFTGRVPDELLPALMAGAMVFAYPSHYEGFGLPPLEAMACGTPVVTSNTTAVPEVVESAALQVTPTDVKAIGHAILRLVRDPAQRNHLSRQGLARARNFTWENTARATLDILQACAQETMAKDFVQERLRA